MATQPGFKESPDYFNIDEIVIDQDHWEEGFVTQRYEPKYSVWRQDDNGNIYASLKNGLSISFNGGKTFYTLPKESGIGRKTVSKVYLDEENKKLGLNELVTRLFENNISYPDFYNEIAENYSGEGKSYQYHRTRIEGARKFAYRKSEQKTNRIKRHKK